MKSSCEFQKVFDALENHSIVSVDERPKITIKIGDNTGVYLYQEEGWFLF